jgi:cytochrome P450
MNAPTSSPAPEVNPFTPEIAACPQGEYARIRAQCPVGRMPVIGLPVVARHEDVVWALRHPEIFSSEMAAQVALGTERPMIPQQVDPPRQTRYRKILDPQFSRMRMAELEPRVRAHATELIDAIIDRRECEFDSAFAIPLPCSAFLGLMGLPQEELGLFLELKDGIIRPPVDPIDLEAGKEYRRKTGRRIYDYFEGLIDERLADPRDDIMTPRPRRDGQRLSRDEILDIFPVPPEVSTRTATLGQRGVPRSDGVSSRTPRRSREPSRSCSAGRRR